jgi:hypothetical protein
MTSSSSKCQCQYPMNLMSYWLATLQTDIGWQDLSSDKVLWRHRKWVWPDDVINFKMSISQEPNVRSSWNIAGRYIVRVCNRTKLCDAIESGRGMMTSSTLKCECRYLRNRMFDWVETLLADIGWQGPSSDKVLWPHQKWAWPGDVINFEMLMSISQEPNVRLSWSVTGLYRVASSIIRQSFVTSPKVGVAWRKVIEY